jgi:hypothetical protein
MGVALGLRRGARVTSRSRRARLLGRMVALVRRSLILKLFWS